MRDNMNSLDFLTCIDKDSLTIYTAHDFHENNELHHSVLLISHEFTRTGAPIALLNMARGWLSLGYSVFVLCEQDGDLREDFIESGANVILYPDYRSDTEWLVAISKYFFCAVINTLSLLDVVVNIYKLYDKFIWWIHESEYMFECVDKQVKEQLNINLYTLSKNNFSDIVFGSVSPRVAKLVYKYLGFQSKLIPFYVPDSYNPNFSKNNKIAFLQVGSINANKRPDLLIEAALRLPEQIFSRCNFTFVGNKNNADPSLLKLVSEFAERLYNVRFLPAMSYVDICGLYDESDIVVVTSMQETVSSVAVEACMKRKICICSDTAGITDFMKTGNELLVYQAGNVDELYRTMLYAVENYNELDSIRDEGRRMYEANFSEDSFKKKLTDLFL